jgi:hypothetical protein
MSEPVLPPSSSDDLQFSTIELGDANSSVTVLGQNCVGCGKPIESTYYALEGKVLCPACCAQISAPPTGSKLGRLVKASLLGIGAGLVGAVIWFAIRRVAHLEVGLVAILVGFMVGKAVRVGSGGRGGRGYQVLAVLITYCCIAANYMPDILEAVFNEVREPHVAAAEADAGTDADNNSEAVATKNAEDAAGAADAADKPAVAMGLGEAVMAIALLFAFVFALSLAAPFLAGVENIIGLLIIAFALWEAWKFNARVPLPITGPYELGPAPTA